MPNNDIKFMRLAINMAATGIGKTFPRPSVGAIIVKDNKLISVARTADGGAPHAEPKAIEQAGAAAKGSTLYVTLEPCNHYGKTPPCADAVIAAGIKKVFIANKDPNPKAAGGIEKLRAAGIEVIEGLCEKEAQEINRFFFTKIKKNRPYIIVKVGVTMDGKIALESGESKYITSEISRNYALNLRSKVDGILVGVNTVINDNPQLTCRLEGLEKLLLKIILDSDLKTPADSLIIKNSDKEPVIIFSVKDGKIGNAEIIKTSAQENKVNIREALSILAEKGFHSLLVEGGGTVISSFLKENLIDELHLIKSAKILGNSSISFASDINFSSIPENQFEISETRKIGDDNLIILRNKL